MKNPNYDAFIFDLGRVLVDFDHRISARKIAALVHQRTSAPEHQEKINEEWLYQFFFESELTMAFDEGRVSGRQFYEGVKKATGLKISYDEFVPIWVDIFREKKDVCEFAANLKEDYRIVLISNVNILQFEHIRNNFPIISQMDALVLSYEVGVMKPDRKIYEAAIKASRTTPERIIYTDDRPELIEAGRAAGINASFVFRDLETFKRDLEGVGISSLRTPNEVRGEAISSEITSSPSGRLRSSQ